MKSLEQLVDNVGAVWSAVWFRSAAKHEVARLRNAGRVKGEPCELAYSVSFDEGQGDAASRSLKEAGFTVADTATMAKGFLTVTAPAELGAYAIASTTSRVRRVAQRHGGHAEMIGIVGEPRVTIELTNPRGLPRVRSVA